MCLLKRALPILGLLALAITLAAPVASAAPAADSAIIMIGDGMGFAQVHAAREVAGVPKLAMEQVPVSGSMTTNSANAEITDSAAAGTALSTGHKTDNGMIAVTPDGRRLTTILERAQRMYKSVGVVSTDALHGATPATFLAHVPDRGMRSEIAAQTASSGAQVMLAFWRGWFLPKSAGGEREDGRNLIAELRGDGYDVVFTRRELLRSESPRLVGLFDDGSEAPSLAEMTTAALERLSRDPDGFVLMVEGARIDWKCHGNDPAGAVLDTLAFDEAVAAGLDFARRRDRTLVLITADHETGGLQIEDAERIGLLGRAKCCAADMAAAFDADGGNIREVLAERAGITNLTAEELTRLRSEPTADTVAAVLSERAGLAWTTGGHTATPVPVFAVGPGAELFAGKMDNTDIPTRLADALGIGPFPPR